MPDHDNDTVRVGPEAFPGAIVARHNGYTLRRETRDDGTVYWRVTRPASGHRIDYRRKAVDVFSVNPEWRGVYGNADTESYAHTMLAAVEAATVFRSVVRHSYTRPEASRAEARNRAADIPAAEQDDTP